MDKNIKRVESEFEAAGVPRRVDAYRALGRTFELVDRETGEITPATLYAASDFHWLFEWHDANGRRKLERIWRGANFGCTRPNLSAKRPAELP